MKIEKWVPGCSFRAKIGKLWFGVNLGTAGFFCLLEGGPHFLSWNPTEKVFLKALVLAAVIAVIVAVW